MRHLNLAFASVAMLAYTVGCAQRGGPQQPASTIDQVCSTTAELLTVDRAKITPSTSLADLGADELDYVEVIMALEEKFDISIPDDRAEQLAPSKDSLVDFKSITMAKLAALVDEFKRTPHRPATP